MTIRKVLAATAIAGSFVLASSSLAFADDARTETVVSPGAQVCVSLPTTADPVRAEGLGDSGVFFTLTSEGIVLAQGPERIATTTMGVPGATQLCATNGGSGDSFVILGLTSGPNVTEAPVTGTVDVSVPAPAEDMSVPAPTPVPDSVPGNVPADVQSLIDQIQRLVDQIIAQVLGALSAVA